MYKKIIFASFVAFFMTFYAFDAMAAWPSQCNANNENCTNERDAEILADQCPECVNMGDYLASLQSQCYLDNPPDIDCATITSSGYYGNHAAAMAEYIENGGSSGGGNCEVGFVEKNGFCFPGNTELYGLESDNPIWNIANNVMRWILRIIGMIAIIAFVISGIQYLTSAGNENQIDAAKRQMKWSIVGVIVALSGLIILGEIYCLMAETINATCLLRFL